MSAAVYIIMWMISIALCITSLFIEFKKSRHGSICSIIGLLVQIALILSLRTSP